MTQENRTINVLVKSLTKDERFQFAQDSTVAEIKPLIAERFDAHIDQISLIYAGRKLSDQKSLSAQNVKDGFAVHLVIRPMDRDLSPPIEARINQQEPLRDISANLLSNPEYLRTLIEADPRLRAYVDQHEDLRNAINNPDVLRRYIEVFSSPEQLQEFFRERGVDPQEAANVTAGVQALNVIYDNLTRSQSNDNNGPSTEASMLQDLLNSPQMQQFFEQIVADPSMLQPLLNNNSNDQNTNVSDYLQTNFGEILRNFEAQTARNGPPEERFRSQLDELDMMGFTNREANIQALVLSNGDLNRAIDVLTRNMS